jgi:large subunit ribosomal protein L10
VSTFWKGGKQFMPTEQKATKIEELTEKVARASITVLVQTQGMTVKDMSELRNKLRAAKIEFQVTKNTLLRIATERNNMVNLDKKIFANQTTVAFGYDDEVATAKAITDSLRNEKIAVLKSAILGGSALTAAQVEGLAKLPGGKNQSKAEVVGTMQGPLASAFGLFTAPLRDLCYVLQAHADQLNGGAAAE